MTLKKASQICTAIGFALSLLGLLFYKALDNQDKGLEILTFGFFICAGGLLTYFFTRSISIGDKIVVSAMTVGFISLFLITVADMKYPLIESIADTAVWVGIGGVILNTISAARK